MCGAHGGSAEGIKKDKGRAALGALSSRSSLDMPRPTNSGTAMCPQSVVCRICEEEVRSPTMLWMLLWVVCGWVLWVLNVSLTLWMLFWVIHGRLFAFWMLLRLHECFFGLSLHRPLDFGCFSESPRKVSSGSECFFVSRTLLWGVHASFFWLKVCIWVVNVLWAGSCVFVRVENVVWGFNNPFG